ncbi:Predicted arabinose efflux permease, MFS family [Micromonospora viridifaciens]|uniref:Predicted arabinose efflux permease, MFS family n=1 Tax=Micromonospora viridifaciens TaxID=1881 RepID=A0A1C4UK96_MICVI|nr:MFS transporter [Micromonospora viridifaciens]SCE72156.1 Predicted arabinose efflux permease, MFS family [Micromonospora viridifaciens]
MGESRRRNPGAALAGHVVRVLGGPQRARVVLLLASVLALNSADTGTVGAAADQLERDLGISHAELGLLSTVSSGVGALASVPLGVLADRANRVRLLVLTIALWAVAMAAGGLAPSYWWLLLSRLLLGAAVGASGPAVASLTGDFIPPADRAAVLGWILTGELVGAGVGLVVGGEIAATLSWRYAFFLLALASAGLAVLLWKLLPEPARNGAGWMADEYGGGGAGSRDEPARPSVDRMHAAVAARGVKPDRERVLTEDPNRWSLGRAVTYLLGIPTNRLLIVASATGYFFFAGLRTFVVVFAIRHFHISQTTLGGLVPIIGVAAVAGTILAGRLTDRALARGHTSVRIMVPAFGYTVAAICFVPGVWVSSILVALPLIALAAAALAAANPPLDAARLDIVPGRLWGRAESLRTVLRLAAESLAPATFGWLADQLAGPSGDASGTGLRNAFLIMLVPLLANGLILIAARRTYPIDVATAAAAR